MVFNKKATLILLISILFFAIGLTYILNSMQDHEDRPYHDASSIDFSNYTISERMEIAYSFGNEWGLFDPEGIAYYDGKVYVTDTNNDRIIISSIDGKNFNVIGQTGNAAGEFIKPRGITTDSDGNIYVVDSGNNRIQILDSAGVYQDQIKVDAFFTRYKGSEYLRDVEVDSKRNIYISTFAYYDENQRIYVYQNKQIVDTIETYSTGTLSKDNQQLFYITDLELENVNEQRKLVPGDNFISTFTRSGIQQSFKLRQAKVPKSVVHYNDKYYILNKPRPSIDVFDLTFAYEETVFASTWENHEEYPGFTDMVVDSDGNFYCVDSNQQQITVLRIKE